MKQLTAKEALEQASVVSDALQEASFHTDKIRSATLRKGVDVAWFEARDPWGGRANVLIYRDGTISVVAGHAYEEQDVVSVGLVRKVLRKAGLGKLLG